MYKSTSKNAFKKKSYIEEFKQRSLQTRAEESTKILQKYPDRIPVVVDTYKTSFELDKHKYLVPGDLTVGQFMYVVRKRCKLAPEKALFLFVDNSLPPSADLVSQIYKAKKNDDGFLYFVVSEETTFGSN